MGVSNASVSDELHQHESELIGHELVMRQSGLGVGGTHVPPPSAGRVTAPRQGAATLPAAPGRWRAACASGVRPADPQTRLPTPSPQPTLSGMPVCAYPTPTPI